MAHSPLNIAETEASITSIDGKQKEALKATWLHRGDGST